MKKTSLVLVVFLVSFAGFVFAQHMPEKMLLNMKSETKEAKNIAMPPQAVEAGNKICPLTGHELKMDEAVKVTVNGKVYNICKQGKAEYDKDPVGMAHKFAEFDIKMATAMIKKNAQSLPAAVIKK